MKCRVISKNNLNKKIDESDIKIIGLMVLNKTNKEISRPWNTAFNSTEKSQRYNICRLHNYKYSNQLPKVWIQNWINSCIFKRRKC